MPNRRPRRNPPLGENTAQGLFDHAPMFVPAAAILGLVLLAYAPAFSAGFIWDDDDYVTANPMLRTLAGLWRIWSEPGAVPQYYPLVFTTFWVEYRLWGLDPAGFHVVNVVLHAANAVLVGFVLRSLGLRAGWWCAAVFALHPVHVESVAWITERKNVLSGFFYLASLLVYVRGQSESRTWFRGYVAALALFAAALLSKTITCSLPVTLLLVAWWRQGRIERRDLVRTLPYFVAGFAFAMVTVWMERSHVGARGADWDLDFLQRCTIAGRAVWFYVFKLLLPLDLTFVYPRWSTAITPLGLATALSVPVVLASLWFLRASIGRLPLAAAGFFVATLFPALGFVDVFPMRYTFVADHYVYLGSLGLIVPLGAALREPMARWTFPVVLAAFAALTFRQAGIYRDAETLWRDTIAKDPHSWMAHNNLGLLREQRGDTAGAVSHYESALKARPDDGFAANNLGRILASRGDLARAEETLGLAIRIDPNHAEARLNLGNLYAATGRIDAAAEQYRIALQIRPAYPDAHANLGNVFATRGDRAAALAAYEEALRLDPGYADAWFNRGVVLLQSGRPADAADSLRAALQLRPQWEQARAALRDAERGAAGLTSP